MSEVQQAVRDRYGAIATAVAQSSANPGCCGPPAACGCGDPISSNLYSDAETSGLPPDAVAASLGCGNPTALLELRRGRPCWISAPAAASTCCCRRSASVRPARPTAWT